MVDLAYIEREHTFVYTDNDIIYLFGKESYKLVERIFFQDHSIFYCFEISDRPINIVRIYRLERYKVTEKIFNKQIYLPPNTYLTGAALWSQLLYSNLIEKKNINGILDSDISKQGNIFEGPNLIIQPYTILKDMPPNTTIAVHKNKFSTNEIISLIKSYNDTVNIVLV